MKIRKAESRDIETLSVIENKLSRTHETLDSAYTLAENDVVEKETKHYLEMLLADKNCLVLVAEEESTVVGYLTACLECRPKIFQENLAGKIFSIYVERKSRGQGLAKKLLDVACQWMKENKAPNAEISVSAHNKEGLAFWDSQGFKTTSMRKRKPL
ncbi:MAG: GNAT family N-acetyltransferase [Candidatus Aenigmarchaeota archaeon]|nr:GNAT family N-acetyltransferase [Candidatus Aenigmarchaeota archaeon]